MIMRPRHLEVGELYSFDGLPFDEFPIPLRSEKFDPENKVCPQNEDGRKQ
jgi:hypothetical protein